MEMQIDMQQRTCSIQMQQGHVAWTRALACSIAARTCSIDTHGQAWTWSTDMSGNAAWICSLDLQPGHPECICIIDRSTDMHLEHAARTCSTYMQHEHTEWTSSKDVHGQAAWTWSKDVQQGHAAGTLMYMRQATWTCSMDMETAQWRLSRIWKTCNYILRPRLKKTKKDIVRFFYFCSLLFRFSFLALFRFVLFSIRFSAPFLFAPEICCFALKRTKRNKSLCFASKLKDFCFRFLNCGLQPDSNSAPYLMLHFTHACAWSRSCGTVLEVAVGQVLVVSWKVTEGQFVVESWEVTTCQVLVISWKVTECEVLVVSGKVTVDQILGVSWKVAVGQIWVESWKLAVGHFN